MASTASAQYHFKQNRNVSLAYKIIFTIYFSPEFLNTLVQSYATGKYKISKIDYYNTFQNFDFGSTADSPSNEIAEIKFDITWLKSISSIHNFSLSIAIISIHQTAIKK